MKSEEFNPSDFISIRLLIKEGILALSRALFFSEFESFESTKQGQ
jgi:hypothetical protein